MTTFEGYADPGFQKDLARLPRPDREAVLATLAGLAHGPAGHPAVKLLEGSRWPGSVRVRCGAYRVLALVLPDARLVLFTTAFRKKRPSDYDAAILRHDRRVAAQGPPVAEHLT